MSGLASLTQGFQALLTDPGMFLLLVAGVLMGIIFGSIPGLTGALGIALILPFTYTMSASYSFAILVGIYVGSISGGLISAILLNIPGTPAALATCFDGSPMALKGEPGKALFIGTFASLIGGLISGIALILISEPLSSIAVYFGYWEYFALGIMGLCIVVGLVGKDLIKGLISAVIGICVGLVGLDSVSAVSRYTFGSWQLTAGFSTLPVLMGLFAMAEIMTSLRSLGQKAERIKIDKIPFVPKKEWFHKCDIKTLFTGSLIGTGVGILPGVGQATAALISYTSAKRSSKEPEKFGTGCVEGIIASESANNAVCGGALIPMMALGIPGDVITAILLGALVIHGLQPGVLLFKSPDGAGLVGVVFAVYMLGNIVMYLMQLGLMRGFVQILKVPLNILYPMILAACMVGAITTNNRVFDAGILVVFGIIGYLMVNNNYPLPPMVLGFVLSKTIETNYRIAMIACDGNFFAILSRPVAVAFIVLGLLMAILPSIRERKAQKAKK